MVLQTVYNTREYPCVSVSKLGLTEYLNIMQKQEMGVQVIKLDIYGVPVKQ